MSILAIALAAAAVSSSPPAAASLAALPPGPGREVVLQDCAACHTPLNVTTQRHDEDGWDQVIGQMVDRGAHISDADQDVIRAYLAKHFGQASGSEHRGRSRDRMVGAKLDAHPWSGQIGVRSEDALANTQPDPTVSRTNNPERTRADIIRVATEEFAEVGLSGARVDRIAERTNTSKRMIYYYFNSKTGLYKAVLLAYYERLRSSENALNLHRLAPVDALRTLVQFTFDWHIDNADVVRLVMVENIHKGRHVSELPSVNPLNSSILTAVADICARGYAEGSMREGLDSFELYTTIAALTFFNVSNRYTFRALFQHDLAEKAQAEMRRKVIWDVVFSYVTTPGVAASSPKSRSRTRKG